MKQDGNSPAGPEKHLDNLYLIVLRDSLAPEYTTEEKVNQCKMLRLVLGTLTVQHLPLSVQALGQLLNIGKEGIERTIQDLHAILDIPKDEDGSLQLHHPSLRHFLLDRNRCTNVNFSIDEVKAHGVLALQCDGLMTRFVQQDQRYYEKMRSTNNPERTSQSFPIEIHYAILILTYHQRTANELGDGIRVTTFIEDNFMQYKTQLHQTSLERDRSGYLSTSFGDLQAKMELISQVSKHSRLH